MQMGPQRAVAGVGTSNSDVGSGNSIHAVQISSLTDVLQLFERHDALDAHTTKFHTTAISRFPNCVSIPCFWFISPYKLTEITEYKYLKISLNLKIKVSKILYH
jgi:hypothetical protein